MGGTRVYQKAKARILASTGMSSAICRAKLIPELTEGPYWLVGSVPGPVRAGRAGRERRRRKRQAGAAHDRQQPQKTQTTH